MFQLFAALLDYTDFHISYIRELANTYSKITPKDK